jgi:basic membrane lipoprotein Med (substrate-binding protein (PBP1-ABC) superfamily)
VTKQVRQVTQARPAKTQQPESRLAGVGRALVTWLRSLSRRTIVLTASALAVVAAVVVGWVLLFQGDGRPPIPDTRARHYTEVDACLLTDKRGITAGTTAASVWQGMQDASLKTHARVNYQQVMGEQSVGNARPFLNGMLQSSCEVVIAVGKPEVTAASQAAPLNKKVGFVLVGGGHGGANVASVPTGDKLRADVAGAMEQAVNKNG